MNLRKLGLPGDMKLISLTADLLTIEAVHWRRLTVVIVMPFGRRGSNVSAGNDNVIKESSVERKYGGTGRESRGFRQRSRMTVQNRSMPGGTPPHRK